MTLRSDFVGCLDALHLALDDALELRAQAQPAVALGERHPRQPGVETGAQELDRRRGGGVVGGEELFEAGANQAGFVGGESRW